VLALRTLDELIDRVGSDPVRYFYLLRSPDTTIESTSSSAVTQGNENPVYYASTRTHGWSTSRPRRSRSILSCLEEATYRSLSSRGALRSPGSSHSGPEIVATGPAAGAPPHPLLRCRLATAGIASITLARKERSIACGGMMQKKS